MKFDLQTDLKQKPNTKKHCECEIDHIVWQIVAIGAIVVAVLLGLR